MSGEFNNNGHNDAKWEPDTEKYNSEQKTKQPEKPAKKKSLWWIPVAAVMTVIVVGVVIASAFGVRALKSVVRNTIPGSGQIIEHIEDKVDDFADSIQDSVDSQGTQQSNIIKPAGSSGVVLTDVSDVVKEMMPSVVSITSRTLVTSGSYGNIFDYYFGYRNNNQGEQKEVESGVGSGTIIGQNDEELLVLTSYHVVEGCSSLYVTFCDENAVDGYVKEVSEEDDIAVVALRLADISESTLDAIRVATLSDESPEVGDGAIVIGNALGYGQSVCTGIVSALDRTITADGRTITVIQTDAAINAGNSGGCLLNSNGEIIGISEAKINSTSVEGMCYAISVNHYYDTIMEMINADPKTPEESTENNDNKEATGAYLGIYGYDVTDSISASYNIPRGVYVLDTVNGGGAESAGIKEGDVITAIDGTKVESMSDLQNALKNYNVGDKAKLTVSQEQSNGYKETEIEVTLTASIG